MGVETKRTKVTGTLTPSRDAIVDGSGHWWELHGLLPDEVGWGNERYEFEITITAKRLKDEPSRVHKGNAGKGPGRN